MCLSLRALIPFLTGIFDKDTLKDLGATAVLEVQNGVQAIYGGKSDLYSQEINQILGREE